MGFCNLQNSEGSEEFVVPGSLTAHKFRTLGTQDAVKQSRYEFLKKQRQFKGEFSQKIKSKEVELNYFFISLDVHLKALSRKLGSFISTVVLASSPVDNCLRKYFMCNHFGFILMVTVFVFYGC